MTIVIPTLGMNETTRQRAFRGTCWSSVRTAGAMGGLLFLLQPGVALAASLYSGTVDGSTLQVHLDTTLEYSNMIRVGSPSEVLEGPTNPNGNDGDSNFQHGLVDNTFEVLPVLDIRYGNYGAHFSGEAYLNTPYLGTNQNSQPGTFNPYTTVSNQHFTSATRNVEGQNAILLDANVYGSEYFGSNNSQELTVKIGRQTLLWGQSLFFASNGIAAGQSPVDIREALSLPNAQTQQILLPVGQAVVTYQPNSVVTIQGYYQFEWARDSLPAAGSYFSYSDILDKGGQRIIVGPGSFLYRVKDLTPPIDNGQFGLSMQFALNGYSLGLYALRWDSKLPEIYSSTPQPTSGPGNVGSYYLVFPRDIQTYGAAASTNIGPVNVGGEISGRRNMPLVSGAAFVTPYPGSANAGALYAVGSTIAAQASAVYISPAIPFDPGGVTALGEFEFNHVVSVTSGRAMLTPGRNASAGAFEFSVSPTYYNIVPNTEIQFPVGLTYYMFGNSQVDSTMNHGYGTYNIGVTATYRSVWTAGLTYNGYFGKPNPNLQDVASLVDRSYVSFNVERTF
jgi:hypothetical protein